LKLLTKSSITSSYFIFLIFKDYFSSLIICIKSIKFIISSIRSYIMHLKIIKQFLLLKLLQTLASFYSFVLLSMLVVILLLLVLYYYSYYWLNALQNTLLKQNFSYLIFLKCTKS